MGHTPKLILVFCLTISACGTDVKKQSTKTGVKISPDDTSTNSISVHNSYIDNDTMLVDKKCVVFFQPDSALIELHMKKSKEEDFRAGADDYMYYINESWQYLDKKGIKILDAKDKKYLGFISVDKKMQLVKLDTLPDLWGLYFFDPAKQPHYADIMDIESDYDNYYK
jgi:hypothetical protein